MTVRGNPCPLCDSAQQTYLFVRHCVPFLRCADCGLARLGDRDGSIASRAASPGAPEPVPTPAPGGERAARQYLDLLARRGATGTKILAVASEQHPFVPAAQARDFYVSRTAMVNVEAGHAPGGPFDTVAVLFELEHASNPLVALERLHASLVPGGMLLVVTPSLDSLPARELRNHWAEWRPENRHYFDPRTIQSALIRAGFGQIEWSRDHVLPSDMVVTAKRAEKRARPLLSVVMPVYNERATFERTFAAVQAKTLDGIDKEIVVVESRSSDGTREVVQRLQGQPGVVVVLEDRPRGKGHAVRNGFQHATGDVILIQDADDEYDVNDYDEVLEPIVTFRQAFVLGSRHSGSWKVREFSNQPVMSAFFNFGHILFRSLLNGIYRQKLNDPFTMYKVFRRDCLHGLRFECNRFDFDYELVIKLIRKGYVPLEVPVNYRSRSFKEGKKVSAFRDPWTWIRALVKYRFVSIWEEPRT